MNEAKSSRYLNSDGRYAFHSTNPSNVDSILNRGITGSSSREVDSDTILTVLDELGFADEFPFDRRTATYCHVNTEYVSALHSSQGDSPLDSDTSYIVVDVTEIDSPTYLADMSIITDLIDYKYAGADAMEHADTPEQAVEMYQESILRVRNPSDISSYDRGAENGLAELVVDGDVPPNAIVGVL